ncbi:hypothetical protein OSTOST_08265, partial [Ostertagia ostertagi]
MNHMARCIDKRCFPQSIVLSTMQAIPLPDAFLVCIGEWARVTMSLKSLLSTPLLRAARVNESVYDGVILVTNCGKNVAETPQLKELSAAVLDFIE